MLSSWVIGLLAGASCNYREEAKEPQAPPNPAGASTVTLEKLDGNWMLLRNDQPYFIHGAGGEGSQELLTSLGGNSIRTWGTDGLQEKLDEAERNRLSVCVGIWLGHERHGFDWKDPDQVTKQEETVKDTVLRFKDHPAVLIWSLGNEMEGFEAGDNRAVWDGVNDLATIVKELDPHHPTMTAIAEIGGERVASIHRFCPAIDIVGINSYGGAASLPERYLKAGGTKPYILTEFGPSGPWEAPKNAWGAAIEPSSTEKAATYRRSYEKAVLGNPAICLGSYAFMWGHKQETTATWFGMLLPDGSRLAAADTLSALWKGQPLTNTCPIIERLLIDGPAEVQAGATIQARLDVSDPNNDSLKVEWVLQADPLTVGAGGDAERIPQTYPDAVLKATVKDAEVQLPEFAGAFRLYAYVSDGQGGAAVANLPLKVTGTAEPPKGIPAKLPLVIYDEAGRQDGPYTPSGWMGNVKALRLNERCGTKPHSGDTCLQIDHSGTGTWGAIAWQHPANDWGDKRGGWDITGAKQLSFWIRGETGSEVVSIQLGIIGKDKRFPDTATARLENVQLTTEWTQHSIDLAGKDLTRIKTGLVISIPSQSKPIKLYLDDCKYE